MKCSFRKSESGQAATEFGVILPAMIILIIAVVVYGRPYYLKLATQNMAYSACSAASRSSLLSGFDAAPDKESYKDISAGNTYGVGGSVMEDYNANSITEPSLCRVYLTDQAGWVSMAFGLDGSQPITGVALFFPANFISPEYGK